MFNDDMCLVYTGDNLESLTERVNSRLRVVFDWCCYNKLSLNPNECSCILFTNKRVADKPMQELDGQQLIRAKDFKYLGVHLDDDLKYQNHIDQLCDKLSKLCGVTYRLYNYLDSKSAKNVYFS